MPKDKIYRVGTGAGFSSDRLDPALDLLTRGQLDAIIFECVGERTLAFGHRDKKLNSNHGYNSFLKKRMHAVLPLCAKYGTKLITNMGVANPLGAAKETLDVAQRLGLRGLKIAALLGDDVTQLLKKDVFLEESGLNLNDFGRPMIGANAYLGADAIIKALETDANIIITGRVADPSLFLAPLCHHFGWNLEDWELLGAGTMVGHLMECGAQVTGGYFADPGYKEVTNLAYVGYPIAEVKCDGSAIITKLTETGGIVDQRTVKEQLLYEVHNPECYLTPDVTANFSSAKLVDKGCDRVHISGATGKKRPDQLKVTVAFDGGFLGEAELSYAGDGAVKRARLAGDIISERILKVHGINAPLRIDLIGSSSLHTSANTGDIDSQDVRLRCAIRGSSSVEAENLLWEVESLLCCGPSGGGGYRGHITPSVMTDSTFISRNLIQPKIEIFAT